MKTQTVEEAAEEYCDKPRCAQMSRDDKAWHRTKAAVIYGAAWARKNDPEVLAEALKHYAELGVLEYWSEEAKGALEKAAKILEE